MSDASNLPYLVGFMTPAQREIFAKAVESNDGKTVGKMLTDQIMAFIGNLFIAGDAAKLAALSGTALKDAVVSAASQKLVGVNAAAAEQVAAKLNNFYRDGASPALIQQTYNQAAVSSTHNAASSEVVLGKYIAGSSESYEAVAQARGSTYFSMSDWSNVQGQLGADKMWNINKSFLDQQMAQNKSFVFTADPASSSAGYFTKLEFQHLSNNGYKIVYEGGLYHAVKK